MRNIVPRSADRIFERLMSLQDHAEARCIAAVWIVWMVTLRKMTKYPLYRIRIGVRANFQDFVIVNKHGAIQHDCACAGGSEAAPPIEPGVNGPPRVGVDAEIP